MPTSTASLPQTSWQELAPGRTSQLQQNTGPALPPDTPSLVQAHGCRVRWESFTPHQAPGETPSPMLTEPREQPHVPGQGQH